MAIMLTVFFFVFFPFVEGIRSNVFRKECKDSQCRDVVSRIGITCLRMQLAPFLYGARVKGLHVKHIKTYQTSGRVSRDESGVTFIITYYIIRSFTLHCTPEKTALPHCYLVTLSPSHLVCRREENIVAELKLDFYMGASSMERLDDWIIGSGHLIHFIYS